MQNIIDKLYEEGKLKEIASMAFKEQEEKYVDKSNTSLLIDARIKYMEYPKTPENLDLRKKLLKSDIIEINQLFRAGKPRSDIAEMFNVSVTLIYYHTKGEDYKKAWNKKITERIRERGRYDNRKETDRKSKQRKRIIQPEYQNYINENLNRWSQQDEEHKKMWKDRAKAWRVKTNYSAKQKERYYKKKINPNPLSEIL